MTVMVKLVWTWLFRETSHMSLVKGWSRKPKKTTQKNPKNISKKELMPKR